MIIEGKDHFVRGHLSRWEWLFLHWTDDGVLRIRGHGNTVMEAYENWRAKQ